MDSPKDVAQIVATVGLPGTLLFVLAYGAWKGTMWFGEEVIKPVVTKIIVFLDTINQNVNTMTKMIDEMRTNQQEQTETIRRAACRFPNGAHEPD